MTSKKYHHLSQEQRYQIEALLKAGVPKKTIAKTLDVDRSTIYREIKRNSTHSAKPPDRYKAANAQLFAQARAYQPMALKTTSAPIRRRLTFLLRAGWSPEQISETGKKRGLQMLSTEAIYLWLYEQKKKGNDLTDCLRRRHRRRRKRRLTKQPRTLIKDRVSIHQRPEEVNAETRLGDMEADLVKCKGGYVVTITERKSLFNLLAIVPNKSADAVARAIVSLLPPFKKRLHSVTSDNGTEFALHKQTAETLNIPWFFCDPYRSQQRGRNENQNGLVRQYLKRDTDLSTITEQQLKAIQDKLNNRPRKKNNYQSPKTIFLNPRPN